MYEAKDIRKAAKERLEGYLVKETKVSQRKYRSDRVTQVYVDHVRRLDNQS